MYLVVFDLILVLGEIRNVLYDFEKFEVSIATDLRSKLLNFNIT